MFFHGYKESASARLRSTAAVFVVFLSLLAVAGVARADSSQGEFQTPDFDAPLFDADAVSLEGSDRDEVVSALAGMVRNFPAEPRIDTDVKEKALALALRLDPLHTAARAGFSIMTGGPQIALSPESALLFSESSDIAATLGRHASRMWRERNQPDDQVLAPLLMELALTVVSPVEWEKPAVQQFARVYQPLSEAGETDKIWAKTVQQQPIPGDGASQLATRMRSLNLTESAAPASMPAQDPEPKADPAPASATDGKSSMAADTANTDTDTDGVAPAEVKRKVVDLPFFAAASLAGAPSGRALLELRINEMDETETSLFGLFGNQDGKKPEMPLRAANERPRSLYISGFEPAENHARASYPKWPSKVSADVNLEAAVSLSVRRREFEEAQKTDDGAAVEPAAYDVSLPLALALEMAFTGGEAAKDTMLSGRLDENGRLVATASPVDIFEQAGELADEYVVVGLPTDTATDQRLRDRLVMGDFSGMIRPQLVLIDSVDKARDLVKADSMPENLIAAINVFRQLEKVEDMTGMISNPAVRTKLMETLELWPDHLSAQLLLMAADAQSAKLSVSGSVTAIEHAIEPLAALYDPDEDSVDQIEGIEKAVQLVRGRFKQIEPKLASEAKPYFSSSVSLVEPLRDYLLLRNRGADNSNAQQRRRELTDKLQSLQLVRPAAAN